MTTEFTSFVEDLRLSDELAPDRIAEHDQGLLRLTAMALAMTTDTDSILHMLEHVYKAGVREGQIAMQQSTLTFVQRLIDLDDDEIEALAGGEDS